MVYSAVFIFFITDRWEWAKIPLWDSSFPCNIGMKPPTGRMANCISIISSFFSLLFASPITGFLYVRSSQEGVPALPADAFQAHQITDRWEWSRMVHDGNFWMRTWTTQHVGCAPCRYHKVLFSILAVASLKRLNKDLDTNAMQTRSTLMDKFSLKKSWYEQYFFCS